MRPSPSCAALSPLDCPLGATLSSLCGALPCAEGAGVVLRSLLLQRPTKLALLPNEPFDSSERPVETCGQPVLVADGATMGMLVARAAAHWEAGQRSAVPLDSLAPALPAGPAVPAADPTDPGATLGAEPATAAASLAQATSDSAAKPSEAARPAVHVDSTPVMP